MRAILHHIIHIRESRIVYLYLLCCGALYSVLISNLLKKFINNMYIHGINCIIHTPYLLQCKKNIAFFLVSVYITSYFIVNCQVDISLHI